VQIQTTAIHVIKEKVNRSLLQFFLPAESESAGKADEGEQRKNLWEHQSIFPASYILSLVTTRSEIRDFLFQRLPVSSRANDFLSRNLSFFLLAGERKMISPIGREVDRGGGTITAGQRQGQQQQRPRVDCNELLHKRVSEHERASFAFNASARKNAPSISIGMAEHDGWREEIRASIRGIDRATVARAN